MWPLGTRWIKEGRICHVLIVNQLTTGTLGRVALKFLHFACNYILIANGHKIFKITLFAHCISVAAVYMYLSMANFKLRLYEPNMSTLRCRFPGI